MDTATDTGNIRVITRRKRHEKSFIAIGGLYAFTLPQVITGTATDSIRRLSYPLNSPEKRSTLAPELETKGE
jgi:hypothetical protein